jgi:adenine deaminase
VAGSTDSLTKNLRDLLPVVTHYNISRCFFVTDDRHPKDIIDEGHIDYMVRTAIASDIDPISAIRLATINTAEYFKLDRLGAVAPGYIADLLVLSSLRDITVDKVFKRGVMVAEGGRLLDLGTTPPKVLLRSSINIKFLTPEDFKIPARTGRLRAIEMRPGDIKTGEHITEARVVGGFAESDPERDLTKVLVIERHHSSENIGKGFLKGLGIKRGALASSVSHDSHNIVVAGTNDADMLEAVIEICRMKGGLAVVADRKVIGRLPLPVAGLMSEQTMAQVKADLDRLDAVTASLGITIRQPFMALSFVTLPVMPDLKLTDLGLFDVRKFEFCDIFVD